MREVHDFLTTHWDQKSPVLLAFSGGPDSLALLSTILEYQKSQGIKLGLAHVDHGWRQESAQEAKQLESLAGILSLPFHLKTLNPALLKGNLEAACREERLNFFKELCRDFNYQAVILGHHADDQAETVLKRLFEGSSLLYLSGLRAVTEIQGLTLWRPMLYLSKKNIGKSLKTTGLTPIEDRTNLDPKFLRGKFRTQIIPQLQKDFGKEIAHTLSRIGQEAAELRQYFDEKILPYTKLMRANPLGSFLDLSHLDKSLSPVELKYLIKRFCELSDFSPSRPLLEKAIELFISGTADRRLFVRHQEIFIDRRRIFILSQDFPSLPDEHLSLKLGHFTYGPWKIKVAPSEFSLGCSNWSALWKEGGNVVLPMEENYAIAAPCLNTPYPGGRPIRTWWTNHKVPAFLRMQVPVIYKDDEILHEFLTGRKRPKIQMIQGPWIKVTVSL